MCFPVSTFKSSQCFKEFYDFILGRGLNSPGLNRMGLKKDMRNENSFFKRVTDIIIPDYPLSIDMEKVQRSKRHALTSFREKLLINCDCSRKPQFLVSSF